VKPPGRAGFGGRGVLIRKTSSQISALFVLVCAWVTFMELVLSMVVRKGGSIHRGRADGQRRQAASLGIYETLETLSATSAESVLAVNSSG